MSEITKETTLSKLLNNSKAQEILAKYNLPCLSCPFAQYEMESLKLGEVCQMYNIDVVKILEELNRVYKK
ncbi:MAG: hydrid cluster protein-associated redox disulfide domain protein [bacterium]|nr:hydrid cluster protein-associated redox disulfide domain protein [bacterium]